MDWDELLLLSAALRAGIVDLLADGDGNAGAVARQLALDSRATALILAVLADLGYLDRADEEGPLAVDRLDGATYSLSQRARDVLLDEKHPEFQRFVILHRAGLIEHWLELPGIIKSGAPPVRTPSPEGTANFYGAMTASGKRSADTVADLIASRLPDATTIVDLGGATGVYSRAFASRGLSVTLVDLPSTVEQIETEMAADGIEVFGGDFFEKLPSGPFDIAFASSITHIYGPDENKELFARIRSILAPGGSLAVADLVRGISDSAPIFAVNMLVHTKSGSTWSAADYTEWLTRTGYEKPRFIEVTPGGRVLVLARVAG